MPFIQSLTLVKVNDKDVAPVTKSQLIDTDSESIGDIFEETITSASDSANSNTEIYPSLFVPPRKRGRKPLTEEERDISDILKKEYFKLYYKNRSLLFYFCSSEENFTIEILVYWAFEASLCD